MPVVTFEEAGQILKQDPRVGRPGIRRTLPPTLLSIQRMMVENSILVCNVGPWNHICERPSLFVLIPAYDPAKDEKKLGYSAADPFPAIHRFAKIVSEDEMGWCEDDGRTVLRDLIGIGAGMPASRSLVHRGVFIPEEKLPNREEIAQANGRLDEYTEYLIAEARDAYDAGPVQRKAVIGDEHIWAGRRRGLNEPWLTYKHTEKSVRCQNCGTWNPQGIARCSGPNCGHVIDFELHFKLEAEQKRRFAEFEELATRPAKR